MVIREDTVFAFSCRARSILPMLSLWYGFQQIMAHPPGSHLPPSSRFYMSVICHFFARDNYLSSHVQRFWTSGVHQHPKEHIIRWIISWTLCPDMYHIINSLYHFGPTFGRGSAVHFAFWCFRNGIKGEGTSLKHIFIPNFAGIVRCIGTAAVTCMNTPLTYWEVQIFVQST